MVQLLQEWTPLCKCYGADCGNVIVKNIDVDDEVDDEED